MDALGIHGLSCRKSAGRMSRHNMLNDIIFRACIRSGVPASKEPTGLFLNDEKRPDGMTLVHWKMGRCVTWDVMCPDTLAISHRPITAFASGAASERAAMLKHIYQVSIHQGSSRLCTNRGRNPGTCKQRGPEFSSGIGESTFHSDS